MAVNETVCVLSKGAGKNKKILKCQPIDAKDHLRNGWILEEQPADVMIGLPDDDSDDATADIPAAEEAPAPPADVPSQGDVSINVNGSESTGK